MQKKYFDDIDNSFAITVRLGELVKSKKRFRQKGVDILMAIDSLEKAYRNQYDTGLFFVGDSDFIPLIEAIKDSGKKVICVHIENMIPKRLMSVFDQTIRIKENVLKTLLS